MEKGEQMNSDEHAGAVANAYASTTPLEDLVMEIRQLAQMSAQRHESLIQAIAGMPRKPRKVLSLIRPVGATTTEGRRVSEMVAATLTKLVESMDCNSDFDSIDAMLEVRMAARRWADRVS